jgi:hypothetical protein
LLSNVNIFLFSIKVNHCLGVTYRDFSVSEKKWKKELSDKERGERAIALSNSTSTTVGEGVNSSLFLHYFPSIFFSLTLILFLSFFIFRVSFSSLFSLFIHHFLSYLFLFSFFPHTFFTLIDSLFLISCIFFILIISLSTFLSVLFSFFLHYFPFICFFFNVFLSL